MIVVSNVQCVIYGLNKRFFFNPSIELI